MKTLLYIFWYTGCPLFALPCWHFCRMTVIHALKINKLFSDLQCNSSVLKGHKPHKEIINHGIMVVWYCFVKFYMQTVTYIKTCQQNHHESVPYVGIIVFEVSPFRNVYVIINLMIYRKNACYCDVTTGLLRQRVQMIWACRVGSVGSVSASRTVGREFASRPGHTKDHHKNGTNCLPAWHAMR